MSGLRSAKIGSRLRSSFLLVLLTALGVGTLSGCRTTEFGDNQTASTRVISYNIRLNTPNDGVNAWPYRKDMFTVNLIAYDADILGVQEAVNDQIVDLITGMHEFSYVGQGRDDGDEAGEYTAIFYKNDRFIKIDEGQFWLSETPDVIGSVGWDAAITRVATWVILRDQTTNEELFVLNTHFDHRGEVARTQSARLILTKIDAYSRGLPTIIMGDFNARPDTQVYALITDQAADIVMNDAYKACDLHEGPIGTFQGFEVTDEDTNHRVDYIFFSEDFSCSDYRADIGTVASGRYGSDHLPVIANIVH
jgi:endonuclease/exonuclease/phosphatase family metal-dependent hydrolase